MNILLAEDSKVVQMLVTRLLVKRGHTVTAVENGCQAIEALKKRAYDLVLTDVEMPIMGGFETARAIRGREKETDEHIPIIGMSATALGGDRERCTAAGFDWCLSKPVSPTELFELLERFGGG